jgi:hypothetical protein
VFFHFYQALIENSFYKSVGKNKEEVGEKEYTKGFIKRFIYPYIRF